VIGFALLVCVQRAFRERNFENVSARLPLPALSALLMLLLCAVVLSPGETYAFIYFQF
jgi:hypothetical protein